MDADFERFVQDCCARVEASGKSGTAFFVGDGVLMTCRHVVADSSSATLTWRGAAYPATVLHVAKDRDAAILSVSSSGLPRHPCVQLDAEASVGDRCYAFGFSDLNLSGDPATVEIEGTTPDRELKLKTGQIRPGLSGSPLVNQRTGRVCGMVRTTRDRGTDLGGKAISAATLLVDFPQLPEWQRTFHRRDPSWAAQVDRLRSEELEARNDRRRTWSRVRDVMIHVLTTVTVIAIAFFLAGVRHEIRQGVVTTATVAVVPLLVLLGTSTVPIAITRIRERRLRHVRAEDAMQPGRFRIGPYEDSESDRQRFERVDGAHARALEWIRSARDPVLYLTGRSGCGKSSILNAYVLPALRADAGVQCITVRSFADPVAEIVTALRDEGLIAAEAAATLQTVIGFLRAPERRTFLFVDQFEELFILGDPQTRTKELAALIGAVGREGRCTIVFVIRSDYIGAMEESELPPLRQGKNWMEIGAFSEAASVAFLRDAGVPLDEPTIASVVRSLAEFDETPGLVRPIALNMAGAMMVRGKWKRFRRGATLLVEYVRDAIKPRTVNRFAVRLLPLMISEATTRLPRTVAELAAETALEKSVVDGCLLMLSGSGLVRRVDEHRNLWEISHDFVARIVDSILGSRRRRLYSVVRPWLAPAALLLSLILLGSIVPARRREYATDVLKRAGATLGNASGGGVAVNFEDVTLPVDGATPYLRRISDLRELDLAQTKVSSAGIAGLQGLAGLRRLKLASTGVMDRDMPVIATMTDLEMLDLGDTNITPAGVAQLTPLKKLRSLSLSGNQLSGIGPSLARMPALRFVNLAKTSVGDGDLLALHGHGGIEELILDQTSFTDAGLRHVASMPHLWHLDADYTSISAAGVLALSGAQRLRQLSLVSCERLTDEAAPGFAAMKALAKVNLNGSKAVGDRVAAALGTLPKLTDIVLKETALTDAGLRGLEPLAPRLENLSIPSTKVSSAGMTSIARMTQLRELYAGGLPIQDADVTQLCADRELKTLWLRYDTR